MNTVLAVKKARNAWLRRRLRHADLAPEAADNLLVLRDFSPDRAASQQDYVVLDLETTGLDVSADQVVAVGAVRLRQGRIVLGDAFDELINPSGAIAARSVEVHLITPDMVSSARGEDEVLRSLVAYIGGSVVVAHNAAFDLGFINRFMKRAYGFALQNLVVDTLRLCRALLLPDDPYGVDRFVGRCRLDALAERFGIDMPDRHSASGDAMATALIFQRMLGMLDQEGPSSLGRLVSIGALAL